MEDVPNIVRARMHQAAPTAEPHPDADLLSAFVEQSLAGRERGQVLEHLSQCAECRDVVAFALPPAESTALGISHRTAQIKWLSWPVLRWGVVAVGVLAVTSFGVLQYRVHQQEQRLVASRSLSQGRLPEVVGQNPPPSRPTAPVETAAPRTETGKQIELVKKAPARVQETLTANKPSSAPDARFSRHAPALRIPSAGLAGTAAGAADRVGPSYTAVEASPPSSSESAPDNELQTVGKAKPVSPQASSGIVPAPLLRIESMLMKGPIVPRWKTSASGTLQRSLDEGKTWLDVNVAPSDSSVKSGEVQSSPAPRTIFRAVSVSSNAAEVWAGGSGGSLYHTIDAGNRWTRVVPSAGSVLLTGDVISIQFSDPRNGTVTTSNAEIWTTVDSGQTWHKQQ